MLSSVLFILCLIAAIATVVMHYHAIQYVGHIPAAQRLVRQTANCWALVVLAYILLAIIGTVADEHASPAFMTSLMVSFIGISLMIGTSSLRYARKHQPAFA